jgi:hypothetical protein
MRSRRRPRASSLVCWRQKDGCDHLPFARRTGQEEPAIGSATRRLLQTDIVTGTLRCTGPELVIRVALDQPPIPIAISRGNMARTADATDVEPAEDLGGCATTIHAGGLDASIAVAQDGVVAARTAVP